MGAAAAQPNSAFGTTRGLHGGLRPICVYQRHPLLIRYYVANATWLACIANHTVIPAKAGTYAAWVPAFAGMTILCGVCYIMPC